MFCVGKCWASCWLNLSSRILLTYVDLLFSCASVNDLLNVLDNNHHIFTIFTSASKKIVNRDSRRLNKMKKIWMQSKNIVFLWLYIYCLLSHIFLFRIFIVVDFSIENLCRTRQNMFYTVFKGHIHCIIYWLLLNTVSFISFINTIKFMLISKVFCYFNSKSKTTTR